MKQQRNTTKRQVAMAWMFGLSTMLATQAAEAQPRWGRPGAPQVGACFYQDANFRGAYFCARPGENIPLMTGRMNDQISSIRTFGDTEVTIFQEPRFRGRWTRIEDNVRNLRSEGWNDRLSSIRVAAGWGRNRGPSANRREGSGIGRIEIGEWREDRDGRRDDRGDRRDGQGDRRGAGVGRNDQTNRQAVTEQQAVEIVARAYRAVLGREPDPASRGFVDKVLRERWTEADVSRELRNSPEYRNKNR